MGEYNIMNDIVTTVTMRDGCALNVKLSEPDNAQSEPWRRDDKSKSLRSVLLFVQSSGPHTYDDERVINGRRICCFDLFANELTRRGVAFCRYSTRGVYPGGEPPMFVTIDDNEYKTYLPSNSVNDIVRLTEWLHERGYTQIALLGWSEGSIIAPLAVQNGAQVQKLLLAGYLGCNLRDILCWQLSGNLSCIFYRRMFDYDKKGYISESDFDEDRYNVRAALFGDRSFAELDINHDGRLDASDFKPACERHLADMLAAIDRGDDDWLRKNHGVRLTSGWFREHFALEPNSELLCELAETRPLELHIFSGGWDSMTPPSEAFELEARFRQLGLSLTHRHFENADHDLNLLAYFIKGTIPDGIAAIIDAAVRMNENDTDE